MDCVSHYRVQKSLGRGGMGEVFLAWDERLERHVAIKRIRDDRSSGPRQRVRFRREARAIARLSHPVIVQIFELVEEHDADYIVMEYVEGTRLDRLVQGRGLEFGLALRLAAELADGLAQAHGKGILHRDFKLENIIVTPSRHAKVLDFGLARMRGGDGQDGSLTESGMLVGTTYAMSPEQARGEALDHRSDLFALGTVLYTMLAGHQPFRGQGVADTLHRVVNHDPPRIETLRADAPVALSLLIAELLAKAPAARPRDARAVADRLARLVHDVSPGVAAESTASALPSAARAAVPMLRVLVRLENGSSGSATRTALTSRDRAVDSARALIVLHHGIEAESRDGGLLAIFERAGDAVGFALALPAGVPSEVAMRAAVHLGELAITGATRGGAVTVTGAALSHSAQVLAMALPRQILITSAAFDLARRWTNAPADMELRWMAHGRYTLREVEHPVELFEVGRLGVAPLTAPADNAHGKRIDSAADEVTLGWRPAAGLAIPRRPNWMLRERLGRGGTGEVWLADHVSGERRVFKFCFEASRLRALKRETTLFRLLSGALGERADIVRLLDWSFAGAPYFIESEYIPGGDLVDWSDAIGGINELSLEGRLAIATEIAEALGASHSVGVLHKDVKPQNVLIAHDRDGRPRARLADFGIGELLDPAALAGRDITLTGFTDSPDASNAGTPRYLAPEVLEGKPATIQADIYAFGVMLYQMVAGDFARALSPGWERDIDDELLREDLAAMVDRAPERRPANAAEIANKLRSLTSRRAQRGQAARERHALAQAELALIDAQRRRRTALAVGALSSVILVVVSVFAYDAHAARARERAARTQAELRRQQAEDLIQFMLVDLRKQLEPVGKLALLDAVAGKALSYFAAVPERELSEVELDSRATALHQLGEVRLAQGKLAAATDAFRASLELARGLAQRDPSSAAHQFGLGQSEFWLGSMLWQQKDLTGARSHFQAYLGAAEQLVARDPRDRTSMLELAYAHSNLGSVDRDLGDIASAERALGAAAGIMETLIAAGGDDALRLDLAHVHAKLGDILIKRGDLVGARGWLDKYLAATSALAARTPDDMQRQRVLGYAHSHLGNLLRMQGDVEGALAHYRDDLRLAERLASHDPDDRSLAAELALREHKVADLLMIRGAPDTARPLLDSEDAIVESLLAREPNNVDWQVARVRTDLALAALDAAQGRLEEAITRARRTPPELEKLVALRPDDRSIATLRPYAWWLLGRLQDHAGHRAEAHATWSQGLAYIEALAQHSDEPRVIDLRARLALALGRVDEAQPLLATLDRIGYREPELIASRVSSPNRPGTANIAR